MYKSCARTSSQKTQAEGCYETMKLLPLYISQNLNPHKNLGVGDEDTLPDGHILGIVPPTARWSQRHQAQVHRFKKKGI